MPTLFTKIITGEIPGTFVHEDDRCVAFLDVSPLTEGHVMVVPREEISHWIDADQDLIDHLMAVAKRIGRAQQAAFDCERIGVLIQGYEIPHLHIHVWPTNSIADFDLSDRSPMLDADALAGPAEKIRRALDQQ
ncbi:histidine triad (HIT) family protein [Brevibacterium sanguinis]|uniref:Histidine triad (HIT) family protein n=2 Tax=Brevibacterium TaxID=1696 RepID=A0A366IKP7_9MICO|nr:MULTISPECIES: HIT family protein [Brevibacterium]RBP64164.1 histidine triad (HIT) family protein [Brevibacterium sanguinis]RBP71544.1 histidine triad (HIT) family protein [Brevibacterium celere]